jgi:hypothetical protein
VAIVLTALVFSVAYVINSLHKRRGATGPASAFDGLGAEGWAVLGIASAVVLVAAIGAIALNIEWLRWVSVGVGILILMWLGVVRVGFRGGK